MLRITSGIVKNKRLETPELGGFRAVQEKAKLALFSIIGDRIVDSTCLDLFAGSGNLGLEALSRGAKWCDFVDAHKLSTDAIEINLNNCGFLEVSSISGLRATKYLEKSDKVYDFIFADPFYDDLNQKHLLKLLAEHLKKTGLIAFFHGQKLDLPVLIQDTGLVIKEIRRYNDSSLTILSK
jgi:16S rRNA (guanine966-N2)-methyltransferase